jgi:hypothetical protein
VRANPTGHPARYSIQIINKLRQVIEPEWHIHDPYAGTGEQLGELADERGFVFTGTEIEPKFIRDKRVKAGDATVKRGYPKGAWTGCTSPVYPNGNADYFASSDKEAKAWKRNTYRHALVRLTEGEHTELDQRNMARFGYRGTKFNGTSKARKAYWELARKSVAQWGTAERFILNVSDFMSGDVVEPFTNQWIELMREFGWKVSKSYRVKTPRYRNGSDESRDQRVPYEYVIVFVRR